MKKLTIFLFFTHLFANVAFAQSTGGFFNQQASKQRIMLEQIAGLETRLQEVKTGYHIIETGLNTAKELKGGTFTLHTAYYSSLAQISPAIQANPKAKAVAGLKQEILLLFRHEISWENQQKVLRPAELQYIQSVYANIQKKCQADMEELALILTPGKLSLTDHERLESNDKLYASMQEKLAFTASFTSRCRQIAISRLRAKADNQNLKQLYGIN